MGYDADVGMFVLGRRQGAGTEEGEGDGVREVVDEDMETWRF